MAYLCFYDRSAGGYPLGLGQGLTRLLQFSGILASENKGVSRLVAFSITVAPILTTELQRLSLAYWELLVKEYFAHQAVMKFTLWKDNQRNEAKPFGRSHFNCFVGSILTGIC